MANDFCELWLKDNYGGLIQDAVTHSAGKPLKVNFRVSANGAAMPVTRKQALANASEEAVEEAPEERYGNVDANFRDPSGNGWKMIQSGRAAA